MENEKTKKKDQRVVLNLSMDQAKLLSEALAASGIETAFCSGIANRLLKTITKHETSNHCKYCGNLSEGEYCTPNCAGLDEKENGVTQ